MQGHVYIMTNRRHGTLYVGQTRDLVRRIHEHRTEARPGFTERYDLKRLVYYESFDWLSDSILREKRIKAWKRDWKIRLIEESNPLWDDLAPLLGFDPL
jgi:putative endonuclease